MIGQATRRKFFSFMGAAPLAGKIAAETAAKELAGVGSTGIFPADLRGILIESGAPGQGATEAAPNPSNWRILRDLRDNAIRKALNTKETRAELEEILYEQYRHIGHLDPDLAANRSYSLAAKLCFQRQRMVKREIAHALVDREPYHRVRYWKENILSVVGIKL